jgi:hypothetical protein
MEGRDMQGPMPAVHDKPQSGRSAKTVQALARCLPLLMAATLGLAAAPTHAAVGEVVYTRGTASIQDPAGRLRLATKGDAVNAGDVISTGTKSFAVLQLADETRIVLRPVSRFAVQRLETAPGKEEGLLSLFSGGFRAVTGFINKRRQGALSIRSATATIGVRGTDFAARLCVGDCTLPAHERAAVTGDPTAVSTLEEDAFLLMPAGAMPPPADPPPNSQDLNGDELGLHVSVFDGEVIVDTPEGNVVLGPGDDGFAGPDNAPVLYQSQAPVARVDAYSGVDPLGAPANWDNIDPGASRSGQCNP